jgi:nicotinamidase-related amidase
MAWSPLSGNIEVTVETPTPKEFTLDPKKTLIFVVDMENTFCKKGNERSFDVIDGNVTLLAKAREAGAKVMYVQSLRHVESPDHTLFGNKLHLLYGTWDSTIVEEITPEPGETVIPKWSNDVWAWHGVEQALEREGVIAGEWTVLVTGVSAATCAEAAALGFANRMYRTIIPLDCTAASVEMEARNFSDYMEPEYSAMLDFTTSEMVSFAPAAVTEAEKVLSATA